MKKNNNFDKLYNVVFTVAIIVAIAVVSSLFIYSITHIRRIGGESPEDTIIENTTVSVTSETKETITSTETIANTETDFYTETTIDEQEEIEIVVSQETDFEDGIIWETYVAPETFDNYAETTYIEETDYAYNFLYDNIDAIYMAKTVNVEAPYCSTMEQAAVMWCILNRVDDGRFGNSIIEVITRPHQFGYFETTPLRDDLYILALDVLNRWYCEKEGEYVSIGRILPKEYLYFWGDGKHNHFRINETDRWYWDWSWYNPYESEIWDIPLYEV